MSHKSSLLFCFVLALPLLSATPATAITIGLSCPGSVALLVYADVEEAEQCIEKHSKCTEGFRINGGHYAFARSDNGLAQGISAGYRSIESAEEKAVTQCESKGDGVCTALYSGEDDGIHGIPCPYDTMDN